MTNNFKKSNQLKYRYYQTVLKIAKIFNAIFPNIIIFYLFRLYSMGVILCYIFSIPHIKIIKTDFD